MYHINALPLRCWISIVVIDPYIVTWNNNFVFVKVPINCNITFHIVLFYSINELFTFCPNGQNTFIICNCHQFSIEIPGYRSIINIISTLKFNCCVIVDIKDFSTIFNSGYCQNVFERMLSNPFDLGFIFMDLQEFKSLAIVYADLFVIAPTAIKLPSLLQLAVQRILFLSCSYE